VARCGPGQQQIRDVTHAINSTTPTAASEPSTRPDRLREIVVERNQLESRPRPDAARSRRRRGAHLRAAVDRLNLRRRHIDVTPFSEAREPRSAGLPAIGGSKARGTQNCALSYGT